MNVHYYYYSILYQIPASVMHQENGTKHPMKLGNLTPSGVLKDHLRHTTLLNLGITDHCFYGFVYIV